MRSSTITLRLTRHVPDLTESTQCRYLGVLHSGVQVCTTYNERSTCDVTRRREIGLSTGGSSWEAGLVRKEDNVAESIVNSVYGLFERPDSEAQ
nr:MAG: hypothetical protein AM324_16475 [Candidatus Thorarchaeota archaeon SMTZ1-83]